MIDMIDVQDQNQEIKTERKVKKRDADYQIKIKKMKNLHLDQGLDPDLDQGQNQSHLIVQKVNRKIQVIKIEKIVF